MPEINLSNSKGRDAVVQGQSVGAPKRVRWVDSEGRQARGVNLLKSTIEIDIAALKAKHGSLEQIAEALVAGDPELDLEHIGAFLPSLTRVYLDPERRIAHKVRLIEVVRDREGQEKERRPRRMPVPNVGGELPALRWSGKLMKKRDAISRFVFVGALQIAHVNGLTYDFLFAMAQELEAADSLMQLGAGPKSNQPLVLRRGGVPYRGFLEGRTQGDKYCLILHLTNLELKAPEPLPSEEPAP